MKQADDFRGESTSLIALLRGVSETLLEETTQFKNWSISDVIRHLHYWNWMAWLQLEDAALLVSELRRVGVDGMRAAERQYAGGRVGGALLDAYWLQVEATAAVFAGADPKARLKWAGPEMSARSSITARLMETWAHGQEVYDHLGVRRVNADRIRNIVVLGVNTYDWTYRVRGVLPPGPMPELVLTAPSGDIWTYGEAGPSGSVEGLAEEFCQVVTQTRNVKDTGLKVSGEVATDWMSKAQCFAGGVADPPAPGTRFARQPAA